MHTHMLSKSYWNGLLAPFACTPVEQNGIFVQQNIFACTARGIGSLCEIVYLLKELPGKNGEENSIRYGLLCFVKWYIASTQEN